MKQVVVIGSGFAGLSAACFLAKQGNKVTVLEKNSQPGGRARSFQEKGFVFDMGPSWYWMPDVFERFFNQFDKTVSDYYNLVRLDPSYQVFWEQEPTAIPADMKELKALFEKMEPGAGAKLEAFLEEAEIKYSTSMSKLVFSPGLSITEFLSKDVISAAFKIDLFQSIHKHLRQYFNDPKLLQLTEFPILFLGALPQNTPALYTLMNYADMQLGTWYPMGGMVEIVNAMYQLAESLGVEFRFNEPVQELVFEKGELIAAKTGSSTYEADAVVASCDYHHMEQLLPDQYRNYDDKYWEGRKMAPSCLIYYVGINKKIDKLLHHNLFFDAPFDEHAEALYKTPDWPKDPLMYVCCPSKTDDTVAPANSENIFILIPVAPGLKDDEQIRDEYFDKAIAKLELRTGASIRDSIVYKRSYAYQDFTNDYNAYKGNAYGLANTLMQTAFLKPSIRNKKLRNLFYAGQLTVPGPGVPPALISGEIVADQVQRFLLKNSN